MSGRPRLMTEQEHHVLRTRLRDALRMRGISMQEAADSIDVEVSHLYVELRRNRRPGILLKLARHLAGVA